LMRGRCEVLIATAATPPFCDYEPFACLREIVQHLARRFVMDNGAHRHRNINRGSLASRTVASFAVPSTLRRMFGIKAKMQQRVVVLASDKNDVATTAAVATAGSAPRDKLLPPERKTTVAAVARLHADSNFIYKHGIGLLALRLLLVEETIRAD
jgi:hypothetical protein